MVEQHTRFGDLLRDIYPRLTSGEKASLEFASSSQRPVTVTTERDAVLVMTSTQIDLLAISKQGLKPSKPLEVPYLSASALGNSICLEMDR